MSGAKNFAKLDMSNAYWQIKIDEKSSKLLTFNTPFGRYKFLRLPFGIHSASVICQQQISQVIEGIGKAVNLQDDILVKGKYQRGVASITQRSLIQSANVRGEVESV